MAAAKNETKVYFVWAMIDDATDARGIASTLDKARSMAQKACKELFEEYQKFSVHINRVTVDADDELPMGDENKELIVVCDSEAPEGKQIREVDGAAAAARAAPAQTAEVPAAPAAAAAPASS